MNDGMHDMDIFAQLVGLLHYIFRIAIGEESLCEIIDFLK